MANKKILVADDDSGILDAMQILLENDGFEVLQTARGENIEMLCEQEPAVIFLDIRMSGINGNVVCRNLKSNDKFKHIPIIMFSANSNSKQTSLDCGADGFIAKPFEISQLLKLAHKYSD